MWYSHTIVGGTRWTLARPVEVVDMSFRMLTLLGAVGAGLLLVSAVSSPTAAASPAPAGEPSFETWANGPVRYLLSWSDLETWRRLPDDQARALFIVRFWRQWDPTPTTLENESRREYWWRIFEANRRYRDSSRPGWVTDRGKIFILLGEPDTEQIDESGGLDSLPGRGASALAVSRATVENDTGQNGFLRWIYRTLPGDLTAAETVFAFTRDSTGEWRLTRTFDLYDPVFPGIAMRADSGEGAALSAGAKTSPSADTPSAMQRVTDSMEMLQRTMALSDAGRASLLALDQARVLRVPAPGETTADIVTSKEFLNRLPVTSRYYFFRSTDQQTLIRIGASVPPRAVYTDEHIAPDLSSFLLLYARFGQASTTFYASNEGSPVRVESEAAGGTAPLEAWAQAVVPPGAYDVGLGLEDAATGQISSVRERLGVPEFPADRPALSSLLPVRGLESSETGLKPQPKVEASFASDEEFGVYFEVYGFEPGHFTLTSRLFTLHDGQTTPLGQPVVRDGMTGSAQGWTFPLAGWPPDRFRIEITASQGAASATGALDFSVR